MMTAHVDIMQMLCYFFADFDSGWFMRAPKLSPSEMVPKDRFFITALVMILLLLRNERGTFIRFGDS